MNQKRTSLEIIAPTIEEAVTKGLGELGLSREAVEIEVLDEGGKGLFGLGSRQSRIRITIATPSFSKPDDLVPDEQDEIEPIQDSGVVETNLDDDQILTVAVNTVRELLDKMKIRADVSANFLEANESRLRKPVLVEVRGSDLSILIGRHAETLNALQYISGLIVGKELGRSIPLIIDVEGYRTRREHQLRQLALRMADQAVKTGRRQVLEPMPANERRIVHLELHEHPQVKTESIGEEPRRKVTIIPK